MQFSSFPYELPPLPYAYNALEPFIDEETMRYHHDKHFQAYADKLNAAVEPYPRLHSLSVDDLLANPSRLPHEAREAILNNAGGVYNHAHFFNGLAPVSEDNHEPRNVLAELINRDFGSLDNFKKQFTDGALAVFGSGWTYLVLDKAGRLRVVNLANQDTPGKYRPILSVDVWEHAYYLKYKNLRGEYLDNIWNVLVFPNLDA